MAEATDDSFKKPGAVPFKWEIKPGVPREQHQNQHQQQQQHRRQQNHAPPSSPPRAQSSELASPNLRPPPGRCYVFSTAEHQTGSFQSNSWVRSGRWPLDRPILAGPDSVPSGCFFSPLLSRLGSRKMVWKPVIEPDYTSDLDTLSRWSLSSRKHLSPVRDSTTSTSSSVSSSPRPERDAEWSGFGLFWKPPSF